MLHHMAFIEDWCKMREQKGWYRTAPEHQKHKRSDFLLVACGEWSRALHTTAQFKAANLFSLYAFFFFSSVNSSHLDLLFLASVTCLLLFFLPPFTRLDLYISFSRLQPFPSPSINSDSDYFPFTQALVFNSSCTSLTSISSAPLPHKHTLKQTHTHTHKHNLSKRFGYLVHHW